MGFAQAARTAARLAGDSTVVDRVVVSPLKRARQTADVLFPPSFRGSVATVLPALREVDLYGLQGLSKAEAKGGETARAYELWKRDPEAFVIDGHAPVRELWHRASLALRQLLALGEEGGGMSSAQAPPATTLVVAHNAINQALIGVAGGWGPSAFRRFEQSNGGRSSLVFAPAADPSSPAAPRLLQVNSPPDGVAALVRSHAARRAKEGAARNANAPPPPAAVLFVAPAAGLEQLVAADCAVVSTLRASPDWGACEAWGAAVAAASAPQAASAPPDFFAPSDKRAVPPPVVIFIAEPALIALVLCHALVCPFDVLHGTTS